MEITQNKISAHRPQSSWIFFYCLEQMAVVTKEITRLLTEASEKRSLPALNEAFHSLKQLAEEKVIMDRGKSLQVSNDLYLFCCEAAIFLEQWPVAQHCADRLVEGTTTSKGFQIRTLYCRAAIDVEDTRFLRGKDLVLRIQACLAKIVSGMKTALQDIAQLSHLVNLGAKHVWNVGRSLFKEGSFGEIVATFVFTVAALEKIDIQDWNSRILWLLRLSTAQAGSSRLSEANASLQKAADLTAKYLPHMKLSVFRMQVALSKVVANPKVKQDAARGALRAVYASNAVFCGLLEGNAAENELAGAYVDLVPDAAPTSPTDASKSKVPSPPPKKDDKVLPSAEDAAMREEVLAELGLALALVGDVDRATDCAKASIQSRSLKSRVYGEYASSLVKAIRCGGMAVQMEGNANAMTPSIVADLSAAVRDVDRTIESAQRISDASDRNHLVQYGCVLIWNLSLALLQPSTKPLIARCLQNAAKHLEDVQSNMLTLRTLLYYEAALTDVDSDFLNKATLKMDKALGTDYHADPDEQKVYSLLKPLDRFLVWLKRKLEVRSNLYGKPDNSEDEALIIIEQANGAPLANRLSMLTRVVGILQDSEPALDYYVDSSSPKLDDAKKDPKKGGGGGPAKKGGKGGADDADDGGSKYDPVLEGCRNHLRVRSSLWHMVLTSAWAERSHMMIPIVKQAVTALTARNWVRKGDRDMKQMQAEALFALADAVSVELAQQDLFVAQRLFFATDVDEDDEDDEEKTDEHGTEGANPRGAKMAPGAAASKKSSSRRAPGSLPIFVGDENAQARRIEELSAIVGAAETTILTSLIDGAKIGADLVQMGYEDHWIVANAAAILWNLHARAFQESRDFLSPLTGFEQIYQLLLTIQLDPKKETELLRDTAFSYVQGLVQSYLKDKLAADPANGKLSSTALAVQSSKVNIATFPKTEPNNPKLVKAWEVCDKMITMLPTPLDAKSFLMASASIQRLLGKPADQRPLPQQRVFTIVEQLKQPMNSNEEKRNLLNNTAMDLLQQDPNVELCARLAAASLTIPDNDRVTVRIASLGNQLYQDGRLGWKQNEIGAMAAAGGKDAKGAKAAATAKSGSPTADALSPPSGGEQPSPAPTAESWHWFALLLQYQAVALSQLVNPVLQEKPTQWDIRQRALVSLTNSAMAAVQGLVEYRSETIRKALHLYRKMCHEFVGDALARSYVLSSVRQLLSEKILRHVTLSAVAASPAVPADVDIVQDLAVLFLLCLRDAEEDDEGLQALKTVMKFLPASHHRPFWGFDIQFRCAAGLPTNQTLLRVKEYAPEIQAQVWVVFAKYAKTIEDQRFAMQSAVDVLGEKPVDQAAHMLLFAQWMLQTNYPITLDVLVDLVMSAVDVLGHTVDTEADDDAFASDMASSVGGATTTGLSRAGSFSGMRSMAATTKSVGVRSVGAGSVQGGAATRKRADKKPSVRALKVALEAYYILARVSGHGPVADPAIAGVSFGSNMVNARSALAMVVHYTMRILSVTIGVANAHNQRKRSKFIKAQRIAAANGTAPPSDSDPASVPNEFEIPSSAHAWAGFTITAEVMDTLKEMKHPSAVGPQSVGNVYTFVSVLEDAVTMLLREGMELQAHPILQLMLMSIEVCMPAGQPMAKSAKDLVRSQLFLAACAGGVGSLAVVHRVAEPYLAQNDLLALREDARIVADRARQTSNEGDSPVAFNSVKLIETNVSTTLHKYWAALARAMLLEGRVVAAASLTNEALFHADAHRDRSSQALCRWTLSQVSFLEGHLSKALDQVREVMITYRDDICAHMFVEMKLFELEVLLALGKIEEALSSVKTTAALLEQQLARSEGLAKDVALRVVPELLTILLMRFCSMGIKKLQHPSVNNRMNAAFGSYRLELANLIRTAMDFTKEHVSLRAQHFAFQIELSKLEADMCPVEPSQRLLAKKKRLCQEARWLSQAIAAAKEQFVGVELDSSTIAMLPAPASHGSEMLCALGQNLLERVELNVKLLRAFRQSDFTTLQYPKVEEDPCGMESNVIYFMRSSRKQRGADVQKQKRRELRREIEERREACRREKQDEIDKRREQRRAETEAANLAAGGKKDAKKPAGKGVVQTEEADVDPHDKCGILSPPGSDDEGHGEDSQSDEEEELRLALRELPPEDIEIESRISTQTAESYFQEAAELSSDLTAVGIDAKIGIAVAAMRNFELGTIGAEERQALLKGEQRVDSEWSASVAARWNKPFEMPSEEDTNAKAKKADAKKPPPKGAKEVLRPVSAPPVDPKTAAEQQVIRAFTSQLELCVSQAVSIGNIELQKKALLAFAQALVLSGQTQAAGGAIETAQALVMQTYITDLWIAASHADTTESVLWNAVNRLETTAPNAKVSPYFNEMNKAAATASKMLGRLRPPMPNLTYSAAQLEVSTFSQDVCVLSSTQLDDERWLVAFRRPSGVVDVRCVTCPVEPILKFRQVLEGLEEQRGALLIHDDGSSAATLKDASAQIREHATAVMLLVSALWEPFQPLLDVLGPKCHIVLCVDPILQPLPLEWTPSFAKCLSVQRELSVNQVASKLQRRLSDKYTGASAVLVVDPMREVPGSVVAALGDEKPKIAGWQLLTGIVDENKQPRLPGVAQVQRAFATPTISNALVNGCGRFTALYPLRAFAGLNLDHIRTMFLFDRGAKEVSFRRENQADMTKSTQELWAEQSWNTALLLLARGVEFIAVNRSTVLPQFNDQLTKTVLANMEKQQVKSFAEIVMQSLRKFASDDDAGVEQPGAPTFADCASVGLFGLSFDEAVKPTK